MATVSGMAEGEREQWTDFALSQKFESINDVLAAIRNVPDSVGRVATTQDSLRSDINGVAETLREHTREHREDTIRIWERLTTMSDDQAARDREYRRNIVIALAPLGLAALGILAKLVGVGGIG